MQKKIFKPYSTCYSKIAPYNLWEILNWLCLLAEEAGSVVSVDVEVVVGSLAQYINKMDTIVVFWLHYKLHKGIFKTRCLLFHLKLCSFPLQISIPVSFLSAQGGRLTHITPSKTSSKELTHKKF